MLLAISAHHRVTPFETLERLAAIDNIATRIHAAHEDIRGAVVLATCNRFEAYLDIREDSETPTPEPSTTAALTELSEFAKIPYRQLHNDVRFAHGNGVARHLFAVTSGLESVAIGEGEITGQVRRALETARAARLTTPALEQLFQRATETSKDVKQSTALTESGRSLVHIALRLAESRIAEWATTRVLLIGTGRYAAVTLAALRALGATDIRVSSASANGERFARSHTVPLVDRAHFSNELATADLVISCTSRDGYTITPADFDAANSRGVLVLDLGLPRNVDPTVAQLPRVELLDLETVRVHAPIDELAELETAHSIVRRSARSFGLDTRVRELAPSITAVREVFDDVVTRELALHTSAEPTVHREIERAVRHASAMLFHRVAQSSQRAAASGTADDWIRAVETTFGVKVGEWQNQGERHVV